MEANVTVEPTRVVRGRCVRALVDRGWMNPDAPRPVARLHVVLVVAVLVAATAVGVGAVLQLINPIALAPALAATPPGPATMEAFTSVSGWDCAQDAESGFDVSGRTSQWYTVARGAWNRDGCHGTFQAIPMSGDRAKDDPSFSAVWWFQPPPVMTRCTIAVFVAQPQRREDSAATAAQYVVLDGRAGEQLAGFVLDQTARQGSWVEVGTFPLGRNGIAVKLVNLGVPAMAGGRLALTQVRVRCTA
jgi:hypothetical protein